LKKSKILKLDVLENQRKENEFWRTSPLENPLVFTIENMLNKMVEARKLLAKLNNYKFLLQGRKNILELGGGQGWASCILKKYYLNNSALVISSDLSMYAVQSKKSWEKIFQTNIDNFACKSYEIPLQDNSIDLIFTFQAAHHFYRHRSTLKEIYRILVNGGVCIYLTEPSCQSYIYNLAYKRVNKKRPDVPEDVLIRNEIIKLAEEEGFQVTTYYDTSFINRMPLETLYYYFLTKFKIFRKYLPCEVDYVFVKSPRQTQRN
jgi:SAM-dependent methyltransferase